MRRIVREGKVDGGMMVRRCMEEKVRVMVVLVDREKKIVGRIVEVDDSSMRVVLDVDVVWKGRSCR